MGFYDDHQVEIRLSANLPVQRNSDPSEALYELKAEIIVAAYEPGSDQPGDNEAGSVSATLVPLSDDEHRWSTWDLLDASATVSRYASLWDFDRDEWTAGVESVVEPAGGMGVLILARAEVLPRYRGHGLGLVACRRLMEFAGRGTGIIAIEPFPLDFQNFKDDKWIPPEGVTHKNKAQVFEQRRRKLIRYWSRLGFKRVPGTDIWITSPAVKWPPMTKVLKGITEWIDV